jgi:hypothetical protein
MSTSISIPSTIDRLNIVLQGWGTHVRTGNAAAKLIDTYVVRRLKRFMMQGEGS